MGVVVDEEDTLARLTGANSGSARRRTERELADRLKIRGATSECALTLLDRDQLEPDGFARRALGDNRKIGLGHHRDLGVASDRRSVGHQHDRKPVARNLDRAGAARLGRKGPDGVRERRTFESVSRAIRCPRDPVFALGQNAPPGLVEQIGLGPTRDVNDSRLVSGQELRRAVKAVRWEVA